MPWFPSLVFWFGIIDAGMVLFAGLTFAGMILCGLDTDKVWGRIGPALGALIGSNVVSALILVATRSLIT
jgi:hypothetical protein